MGMALSYLKRPPNYLYVTRLTYCHSVTLQHQYLDKLSFDQSFTHTVLWLNLSQCYVICTLLSGLIALYTITTCEHLYKLHHIYSYVSNTIAKIPHSEVCTMTHGVMHTSTVRYPGPWSHAHKHSEAHGVMHTSTVRYPGDRIQGYNSCKFITICYVYTVQ